jgi:DNA-binding transcriptional regulator YiaG
MVIATHAERDQRIKTRLLTMQEQATLDIYAIRRRSRRTQAQFAGALGIPPNTLRSWEQHRKRPSDAARTLLRLIERRPELLDSLGSEQT